MFDASTWDSIRSMHIIKDEIKMVKGHYAYITRMHKQLALMALTTITMSKNSYILGPILFCSNTDKMLVDKFPTMPCVYMTTKKKEKNTLRGKFLWPCYDQ